ncbi:MAG: YhgE/Pip domain-containing protein [Coriobacteriia bacterium]|nr:YhgE/Pip domain-containing protein [Coriobacteriia bacterium]
MKNIWLLFVDDLKRIGGNTITTLVVLGLILLPSLFSWFNLLACWDVFENTGSLTVAVANTDEGYESDLAPIKVNIGERVVSALRANDQLNWVFTTEKDAINGTQSGRYYAAVVIPPDFSRTMMSFYESDETSASIIYYSNDKKSAIAPKVTDQGADQVSNQVNRVFTQTLSEVALEIAQGLQNYADEADVSGNIGKLAGHLGRVAAEISRTAQTVELYAEVVETAQTLVDDSAFLLGQSREAADAVAETAAGAKESAEATASSLEDASAYLGNALDDSIAGFASVPDAVDSAFDSANTLAGDAATQLRNRAKTVDAIAGEFHDLANEVAQFEDLVPPELAQDVANLVDRIEIAAQTQDQLRDSLLDAATSIEENEESSEQTREQVKELAGQASSSVAGAKDEYETTLKPTLAALSETLQNATSTLTGTGDALGSIGGEISGTSESIGSDMGATRDKLLAAADDLKDTAQAVEKMSQDITDALNSGDADELRKIIGANPEAFAAVLSAPVALERQAIYPVENFGSAMSPLYTSLALWIGSLLMMVALKVLPGERSLRRLKNPTLAQQFCGRFGVVALISLCQSTVMALGNLLFVGVQAENPLLYMLCFWVSGLVFAFIIYTLVASFANLGKGIAVVLLILQVSAGGGSFPLQLLPTAIQDISPFLPLTHVVNAMRAAMFGVYNGDFWMEMGIVVLFAVPLVLLGLVFRNPLLKVTARFLERVEASKVM